MCQARGYTGPVSWHRCSTEGRCDAGAFSDPAACPRFEEVFARQPAKQRRAEHGVLADDDGYEEKISKWKSNALAALESSDWWAQLVVLHVSRGPVMHLIMWLQSKEARMLALIHEKARAVEDVMRETSSTHVRAVWAALSAEHFRPGARAWGSLLSIVPKASPQPRGLSQHGPAAYPGTYLEKPATGCGGMPRPTAPRLHHFSAPACQQPGPAVTERC